MTPIAYEPLYAELEIPVFPSEVAVDRAVEYSRIVIDMDGEVLVSIPYKEAE